MLVLQLKRQSLLPYQLQSLKRSLNSTAVFEFLKQKDYTQTATKNARFYYFGPNIVNSYFYNSKVQDIKL